jgi:hypothetical protein
MMERRLFHCAVTTVADTADISDLDNRTNTDPCHDRPPNDLIPQLALPLARIHAEFGAKIVSAATRAQRRQERPAS